MARRLALLICLVAGAATAGLAVGAAPAAAAPSRVDGQFLRAAHEINLAQLDGGRQAQRRGVSKQVRDLGAKFVADHTRLDRGLRQAATALRVVLPAEPAEPEQGMLAGYATSPAEQFDALFIASQLDVHTAAIRSTATELAQGTDPRAIKVAKDLMAVLRTHYDALNAAALELDLPSQHTIEPSGQPTGAPTVMTVMVLVAMALIIAAGRAYRPRGSAAATAAGATGATGTTAATGEATAATAAAAATATTAATAAHAGEQPPAAASTPRSRSAESP